MRTFRGATVLGLVLLSALLAACAGYTEMGARTTSHQDMNGGDLTAKISKANGTATREVDVTGTTDLVLEVDVTLAVGVGSYKIEFLGKDQEVTLAVEARDGQTVTGHGQAVTDGFGQVRYRVTAVEAENVDYVIEYTFQ